MFVEDKTEELGLIKLNLIGITFYCTNTFKNSNKS